MTVWIQKTDNEIADDFLFSAYLGFKQKHYNIQFFTKPENIHYKPMDIVVGSVQDSHYILKKLGITPPNFYIPEGAESFCGRNIYKATIKAVKDKKDNGEKFFFKPVNTKEFPAQQVIDKFSFMAYPEQELADGMECWVSDLINIISEYRVFIINKEAVGCQYYLGDFRKYVDWNVVDNCIKSIKIQPIGWTLDFGVTDDGQTILIEANDGYSIGDYGLYPPIYVQLLEKRWRELTS